MKTSNSNTATINGVKVSDADFVNVDDFIPAGEYNPHNVRLWVLHDHGFVVACVFADCLQDAVDIAVDENKMDRYQVTEDEAGDYGGNIYDSESLSYLGNAGEPFDIDTLQAFDVPSPEMSICKLISNN